MSLGGDGLRAALAAVLLAAAPADAQTAPPASGGDTPAVCDLPVPPPARLPPAGSPPVIYAIVPCFAPQGGRSLVAPETYLYYIATRPSLPSQDVWRPYDEAARERLLADFRALWATGFLDDLRIDVVDYPFANGVVGKIAVYVMEERQRIRIVDYTGSRLLDTSKIEDALKEEQVVLRLDTFLDDQQVRRVKAIIARLLAGKGRLDGQVRHRVTPLPDNAKVVRVTFEIVDGPKYVVDRIEFTGNHEVSDRRLRRQLKETKARGLLSILTRSGTYDRDKYIEDAEQVVAYYRDRGYLKVRVENPEVRMLEDSADGRTRKIELRVPVTEGPRYTLGSFTIADNTAVKTTALDALFKVKPGKAYREKPLARGMEKARELYGAAGYFEFTGYPQFAFSDDRPGANAATAATVDVTMHMQEGAQFFVNRIRFAGNTTTRDNVIRRELRLLEGGVFNTDALKYSIRRIDQLGYFEPIGEQARAGGAVDVQKTPGTTDQVDVTLKLKEHNRNELTFGGGLSGLDGLYLNGSYATTNFLGKGETFQVSALKGARANQYQIAVTEPYLFDRPISAATTLYTRKIDYLLTSGRVGYSEARNGLTVTAGRPLFAFTNAYLGYSYEVIDTAVSEDLDLGAGDPAFDSFLDQGWQVESRATPAFVYNTVDNPLRPRRGMRITGSYDVSGGLLGGTVDYVRPEAELVLYIPHTRRTALGLRGQVAWIGTYGETTALPYYRRYFLGGETQIRGYDIRTVGPLDAQNRALGGNKFVLVNAEYYVDLMGSVRALLFHDAGQAYAAGTRIDLRQLRTSSGVELRVVMPVMNVPLRLIYAWNVYRDVFQPARTFRFAVGTTF